MRSAGLDVALSLCALIPFCSGGAVGACLRPLHGGCFRACGLACGLPPFSPCHALAFAHGDPGAVPSVPQSALLNACLLRSAPICRAPVRRAVFQLSPVDEIPFCRGEFAGFLREMPGQKKHLRQKPFRQAFRKKAALRAEGKWAFQ